MLLCSCNRQQVGITGNCQDAPNKAVVQQAVTIVSLTHVVVTLEHWRWFHCSRCMRWSRQPRQVAQVLPLIQCCCVCSQSVDVWHSPVNTKIPHWRLVLFTEDSRFTLAHVTDMTGSGDSVENWTGPQVPRTKIQVRTSRTSCLTSSTTATDCPGVGRCKDYPVVKCDLIK